MSTKKKRAGLLAEFDSSAALFHACEKIRDAGYRLWDSHTPFPVHGLDKAMGLKASSLPWIVLAMGLTGAIGALALQGWVSTVASPLVISGKPLFSWQAFVPITFEVMVLFAALGSFLGMLGLNQLPRYHHPVFDSTRFEKCSDHRFFITVDACDPLFDENYLETTLKKSGAIHTELLWEDA